MDLLVRFDYRSLSLLLYFACLYPQACAWGHDSVLRGMHALSMGWLAGGLWFANPLLLGAFATHRKDPKTAYRLGWCALLLAGSALALGWSDWSPIPPAPHGGPDLRTGYYLWLASMLVFVMGQHRYRRQPTLTQPPLGWLHWVLVAGIVLTIPLSFVKATVAPARPVYMNLGEPPPACDDCERGGS